MNPDHWQDGYVWARHGTGPQAPFTGSNLQQMVPYLGVKLITEANKMLKEVRDRTPETQHNKLRGTITSRDILELL